MKKQILDKIYQFQQTSIKKKTPEIILKETVHAKLANAEKIKMQTTLFCGGVREGC